MSETYKGTTHTHTEKKMGFQEYKPSRVFDDVSLDILALKSMQLLLFLLKFIIFFYYLDFPSCYLIRWQPVLLLLHAVIKTSFFSKKTPHISVRAVMRTFWTPSDSLWAFSLETNSCILICFFSFFIFCLKCFQLEQTPHSSFWNILEQKSRPSYSRGGVVPCDASVVG